MDIVQAILVLMAACVGFALLARRLRLPYAAVLVVGGMVLAFLPGVPDVTLDPTLALAFFLPPLLQGSAYRTDWRAFRSNLRPILLLAVGAVLWTAACVAVAAKWLLPDLPWAAAVALGAIVAPPDAVAAAAVLQRLRLPKRITTILEGESLVNDATALVLYRFAIAALAAGPIAFQEAALSFVVVAVGGILVGLAVARVTALAISRIDDTLLETAVSFLACFGAFFAAEALHTSGVIAVVACGIFLGQRQHQMLSARSRLEARTVWEFVEFVLTSLIFILVGLQLNGILERISGRGVVELAWLALVLSVVLILSRFLWVFPATWLPRLSPALRRRDPLPPWQQTVVISWAGMRGVVSLAAALALPLSFPERDLIVFLAFCAILATLILQGTTLEALILRLRVDEAPRRTLPADEAAARHAASAAMRDHLAGQRDDPLYGAIAADLLPEYADRARIFEGAARGSTAAEFTARMQLRLAALRAGREALIAHHRGTTLPDEVLVAVQQDIDLEEMRVRKLLGAGGAA